MSASEVREVWALPVRSQEFEQGPRLEFEGSDLRLLYDFRSSSGELGWEAVTFPNVAAYAFVSYEHCSPQQAAAYDRLIEVRDSEWLHSLSRLDPTTKHFRLFFDEIGCYEVAASGFVPPPEGPG
jgi:hypothetical protein